ncbi:MAG: FmdB family zinc ribbon protein [Acidimicrobiales bacterium]|jgi:putative FmdB family regulatory protein
MPVYEYVCKSCGDGFEITQAFADSALTTCDRCGGPLRKVYGSIGIVFKGGGFYRTDNRSSHSSSLGHNGSSASEAVANAPEPIPPSKADTAAEPPGRPGSAGSATPPPAKPTAKV